MDCILNQFTLPPNIPAVHGCASICLITNSCRLYCLRLKFTGNECSIFSALVTQKWNGDPASSVTFDVCYSTWYHSNDITHFVSQTSGSTIYEPYTTSDKAVDGFSCKSFHHYCFHSDARETDPSWWRADLGAPRSVTRIMVFPRNDGSPVTHYSNVVITLGNSPVYTGNPQFAQTGTGATGQMMDFTVTTPMIGRYLEFKTDATLYLLICEVKIIS
ncbi:hypothetical protein Pcinc_022447 [Petrolisthes cinctipes]|uniref:Fucolectin tachylectin-4 pentraxin-1 domain-containing protein n=1 Tax=Petrolisthes cinctipes TaxID=88211 RepID=A0AAE1FDQ5_PETCI|nr:hypothetical protein Pcinc_022447 [Petrolisthes cinctipes]